MEYILIIGAIQALFVFGLLILRNKPSLSQKVLIIWMGVLFLNLGSSFLTTAGFFQNYPLLYALSAPLVLLHGPLLYLYVYSAFKRKISRKQLFHLLPFAFFFSYIFYQLVIVGVAKSYQEIQAFFINSDWVIASFEVIIHLALVVYVIFTINVLRRYQQNLPHYYSFVDGVSIQWLRLVLLGLVLIAGFLLLSVLLSDFLTVISLRYKAYLFYGSLSILPFYLLFYGVKNQVFYHTELAEFKEQKIKYQQSGLTQDNIASIAKSLEVMMLKEKPFLDGQLTIAKLATMMKVHQKQLSQVINEYHQTNFFNYINQYRVEEFKTRVQNPTYNHFSLLAIALDCGFNSKSSFNNVFKQIAGQTPSAYKKSLKNADN